MISTDNGIWNVLHDGHIADVAGCVPGNVRATIEIGYLCRHLPTHADYILILLEDCTRFQYRPYEPGEPIADHSIVGRLKLEMLDAAWSGDWITIGCADGGAGGELELRYGSAKVVSVEGRPLTLPELEAAATEYWERWRHQHK